MATKYPFLVVSDAHLTVGPKQRDAEYALDQVAEIAIANKVKAVIASGDTIDKQRNRSAPIAYIYRFIEKLRKAKIDFYFVEGQHDADDPPWYSGAEHAKSLHKQAIDIEGLTVYGLNCLPKGRLQEELDDIPETVDVLIAHQVWANWMGDIAAPQGEFADIPQVKYVITGDYHKYVLEKNVRGKDGQKMVVCSPGATYQKAINEPSEHFCVLFDTKGAIVPVKLDSRVFIDWSKMITEEDLEDFVKGFEAELTKARATADELKLPEELRRPMVRTTYAARLQDALRRIEKTINGRAWLFAKEIPAEAKSQKIARKAGKAETVTPLSVLSDEVDPKEEPEVHDLVARLLDASDVDQTLATWRQEQLED